jgi:phytoene desaturase
MSGHVAVIGAGFAGLAAATGLAARGHGVTLFEAEEHAGGEARRVEAAGARIDVGPTVITDLGPLYALFDLAGTPEELEIVRPDPGLLVTWPGGRRLAVAAAGPALAARLAGLGPHAAADWSRFAALGRSAERLAHHFYARGDVASIGDLSRFLLGGGLSARDLWVFTRRPSLARLLEAEIRAPELRSLLGHFARFLGLDARTAPSIALVIASLVLSSGISYVRGGLSALADALLRLATKQGVVFAPREPVEGLETSGGRVRAVLTATGGRVPVDACVSCVDATLTARWVAGVDLARRLARLEPALAARVAWWVAEGEPAIPVHHALHFDVEPSGEPLYVATPTVSDPGLAPSGVTVLYALLHGPAGEAADHRFGARVREAVVAAGAWPAGRVLAHGVAGGRASCYGYRIGPGLFASFRPSQHVARLANLILAGASVFPGPGVTNVIRSGLRAAALVDAALGGGRS